MSEEKKNEGSFDPGCITDIQDKLLSHNYVLRAFATLLMSSDLSDFATQYPTDVHSESNYEADTLRFGLSWRGLWPQPKYEFWSIIRYSSILVNSNHTI